MQETSKDLLALEDRSGDKGCIASDAGTATDSDDSLEPYDLTEDKPEGFILAWIQADLRNAQQSPLAVGHKGEESNCLQIGNIAENN